MTTGTGRGPNMVATGLIFDLDGVLIDTAGMVAAGQRRIMQALEIVRENEQNELLDVWRDLAVMIGGEVTPAFLGCLLEECRLRGLQVRERVPTYESFFDGYWQNVSPIKHVPQLLKLLHDRNISVGVLSNGNHESQIKKLQLADLLSWFDPALIEIHESVSRYAKPDPSVLRRLIDKIGTAPSVTAYVGDRASDILTAKLCGCISVLFADNGSHPNVSNRLRLTREIASSHLLIAQPDFIVNSPSSLGELLM